jgi:hypothetical protein
MLRLLNARTGAREQVTSARPGLLRVCVHARSEQDAEALDLSGLRAMLVADLLGRVAERRGVQVLTAMIFSGEAPTAPGLLEPAVRALGIHPPVACSSLDEVQSALGGTADVDVVAKGWAGYGGRLGLIVLSGTARYGVPADEGETVAALLAVHDALAVRLALMSHPHHEVIDLVSPDVAKARVTLSSWRRQVAQWAESPSRPIPEWFARAMGSAYDDLEIVLALRLLHDLETDADAADGAKLEAFMFADRILGLELAREIGRPRPGGAELS